MMGDCQDLSPIGQLDVYHVVREPADENASDIRVGNAGHGRTRARSGLNPRDHTSNRAQKVEAETGLLCVIPARRLGHVGLRPNANPDATLQRCLRSRSRRSRTSGHGLPRSSPDRARAARSSISAAQAASASSSDSASRLASSPAASSARSRTSSLSASSRSLLVAFVTGTSLARPPSPNKALERNGGPTPQPRRPALVAGRSAPDR